MGLIYNAEYSFGLMEFLDVDIFYFSGFQESGILWKWIVVEWTRFVGITINIEMNEGNMMLH